MKILTSKVEGDTERSVYFSNYIEKGDTMGKYIVYLYRNKINDKKYCGITKRTMKERAGAGGVHYIGTFKNKDKCTSKFGKAILKYGWDNFEGNVIFECSNIDNAKKLERFVIKELKLTDDAYGYNITEGGDSCRPLHGEENGMFGKGYKLQGSKNGRAEKVEVIFPNGDVAFFDTHKECREHLNISKDLFRSISKSNKPFKFSRMTNKSKIKKNKHIIGIIINTNHRKIDKRVTTIEKAS